MALTSYGSDERLGLPEVAATRLGSAPGWPVVLYFHHVTTKMRHYSALTPDAFRRALDTALTEIGPALEPTSVRPGFVPPRQPSVLITFDDGYRSVLTQAAPILNEFDVRILLFVVTGQMGCVAEGPGGDLDYLSWGEAGELITVGHVISAHTVTHERLTEMTVEQAQHQVTASLAAVGQHLGNTPSNFAYPYGMVPDEQVVPDDVFGYATVRAPAFPWNERPHQIRRNYLPTNHESLWPRLCRGWKQQWHA